MKRSASRSLLGAVLMVTLLVAGARAAEFSGRYHSVTEDGVTELELHESDPGRYEGTLTLEGYRVSIAAVVRGEELVGELRAGDEEIHSFKAHAAAGKLLLLFDDGEYISLSPGPPPAAAAERYQPPSPRISINGEVMSTRQIRQLAQYGIQAEAGDYWYDPVCGAWGIWGGPTAGFVQAQIPSPPLPANASNGTTGVFVNGRNITVSEHGYLQALARSSIPPGQYWLDAMGNAGLLGGPALINYLQAARAGVGADAWYGRGSSGWTGADGSGGVWVSNPYGGTGTTVTY